MQPKQKTNKLTSLSIFFPFYNDEGTVELQIESAYTTGNKLTNNLEVIAIHGGASKDGTFAKIKKMQSKYPNLKIIDKTDNTEGYAVIKHGFNAATKDWVFYTDGDAQYHLDEDLPRLVVLQSKTNADVVNGIKRRRGDNFVRMVLGRVYARIAKIVFMLPIRDVDCDFRLIRREYMQKIALQSTDASILPEMIKKLELAGAKFVEIKVSHYERIYGQSNYSATSLVKEKILGDLKLFFNMRKYKHI